MNCKRIYNQSKSDNLKLNKMLKYKSEPKEPKTLPGEKPDKDNQPDKGSRRKEGHPAESDFIAEEQAEKNAPLNKNPQTSTILQEHENSQDQKKEGNPAEKNFTPEESNEEKNTKEPQL
jgi:hypothetical protein